MESERIGPPGQDGLGERRPSSGQGWSGRRARRLQRGARAAGSRGEGVETGFASYLRQLASADLLTHGEEVALGRAAAAGSAAARQRLIESNLRLVVAIARPYQGQGTPIEDLVQDGMVGLVKAVDRFDPERGVRFSTYAVWWIRQSITEGLTSRGRTIRLPLNAIRQLTRVNAISERLQAELGREPTMFELSLESGYGPEGIRHLLNIAAQPVSLAAPAAPGTDDQLLDLLEDSETDTELAAVGNLRRLHLRTLLARLRPACCEVLALRYGLRASEPLGLRETARRLGVSVALVRRRERVALQQLREWMHGGREAGGASRPA